MGSVNYSNSANGWDVDINWDCDWDDSEAYMTIQINQNSYGRTFQVVQRSNTGNRYDSGSYLNVGTEYLLYVYKNGSHSQQAGPFTVTAPSRPKYTIRYDANGGTGAPSSQTKTYGYTLTLSSTKPTRTGYNFLGWSTSKTATSATRLSALCNSTLSMLIRPHRGQISAPACCVSLIFSITFIRVPPMYCTLPAAMLIHQIQDPYILVCKSAHTMM